jgi:hypothetical protein
MGAVKMLGVGDVEGEDVDVGNTVGATVEFGAGGVHIGLTLGLGVGRAVGTRVGVGVD